MNANRRFASSIQVIFLCLGLLSAPAWGQVTVTVSGNQAVADINVSGIQAEFSLTFEQPQNLSATALGISARVVSPTDPLLLARLPVNSLLSIPQAMPLLITVEPAAAQGLAFSNVAEVEVHTHLLPFAVDSPLRLYKARQGGQFYDITSDILPGSVRTRGHTGGFSDFLVLVDLMPSRDAAEGKYAYLEQRLLTVSDSQARLQLQADLAASRSAFVSADFVAANSAMATFEGRVRQYAGNSIANRWRAQRDLDNVAGDLLSEAGSLRFNLRRLGG